MTKENAIKITAPYFKIHEVEFLFVTEDGQVFNTENYAWNHSRDLKEKGVTKVSREEATGKKK